MAPETLTFDDGLGPVREGTVAPVEAPGTIVHAHMRHGYTWWSRLKGWQWLRLPSGRVYLALPLEALDGDHSNTLVPGAPKELEDTLLNAFEYEDVD